LKKLFLLSEFKRKVRKENRKTRKDKKIILQDLSFAKFKIISLTNSTPSQTLFGTEILCGTLFRFYHRNGVSHHTALPNRVW
jgi:hypothetical protein